MKFLDRFRSNDPNQSYSRAIDLIRQNKDDQALATLERVMRLAPDFPSAYVIYSLVCAKKAEETANPSQHREWLERALKHSNQSLVIHNQVGGLDENSIRSIYIRNISWLLALEHNDRARHEAERALDSFPDDVSMALSLLKTLYDNSAFADAEAFAFRILSIEPKSVGARFVWKRSRLQQNKSIHSSLPDSRKQQVFQELSLLRDRLFFEGLKGTLVQGKGFDFYSRFSQSVEQQAYRTVAAKVNLSIFEIMLIEHEGETKEWTHSPYGHSSRVPIANKVAFRDSIYCVNCSRGNLRARYWPYHGDNTAFYAETLESVLRTPGVYRLPLLCPHCEKITYVVWDINPGDTIGGSFLKHLERLVEIYPAYKTFVFEELIADKVLGRVVGSFAELVNEGEDNKWRERSIRTRYFEKENIFHLITFCPETDWDEVRRTFGGKYFQYIYLYLERAGLEKRREEIIVVNWLYFFHPDRDTSFAHMGVWPFNKNNDFGIVESIVPNELMNISTNQG